MEFAMQNLRKISFDELFKLLVIIKPQLFGKVWILKFVEFFSEK